MRTYKPTIGIEVHAELKTKSKMFCGCTNDPHASEPNTHICPVCMAHPGSLPTVNKEAIKKLLVVGGAVGGQIADFTEFDRKNYFYPDIPKAYQLSQYQFPFVYGGELAGVALTRIHLEEDTARSQHDKGEASIVDFNRAGVPLMELVTEPVIHDASTAGNFTRELQLLLKTLGVSDANMERGEMRVEANISVSADDTLGTKVEVKNLNSFKAMEAAIAYEIRRQTELLESGDKIIQETRGWDEGKGSTFSQRTKEGAADYRYFPDPDIPKMLVTEVGEFEISRIKEITPILPSEKRVLYQDLGIAADQIEVLIMNLEIDSYMQAVTHEESFTTDDAKLSANYLTSDLLKLLTDDTSLCLSTATAPQFLMLMQMLRMNEITSRVAKDLLSEVVFDAVNPKQIASDRGLLQMSSSDDLIPVVEEIIAQNESVVAEFKAGKEAALKFLVGQGMKASRGSANPEKLSELLREKIG